MDKISNPFSPGAGSPPPELAGRESILEQARVLLGRILAWRSEKSLLLTGLRGVGKTVLLNEIERMAQAEGCRTILVEAHEGKSLAVLLAPHLRRLLFELDRLAGAGNKARRGLAVLKSFIGGIRIKVGEFDIGIDIEPEAGSADSGDLEVDLPSLFTAIAEAAEERGAVVVILIDEIQYFEANELSALIMAMHRMQQRQLPLVLIGAGLPILPTAKRRAAWRMGPYGCRGSAVGVPIVLHPAAAFDQPFHRQQITHHLARVMVVFLAGHMRGEGHLAVGGRQVQRISILAQ